MEMGLDIHPTGPGLLCAAAAVVAGAPLFSHGLRAIRLRRQLATLRVAEISNCPLGLVHVRGRVVLEEPLIAPLSGLTCAQYRLEVRSAGASTFERVDQGRPFLITDGTSSIRVHEQYARLEFKVVEQRELRAEEAIDEALNSLLAHAPEAAWARSAGATLHLVERVLVEGAECHVIGVARSAPLVHAASRSGVVTPDEVEWLRTGTDDTTWHGNGAVNGSASDGGPQLVATSSVETPTHDQPPVAEALANRLQLIGPEPAAPAAPRLWIGADRNDFLYFSDAAPDLLHLSPPVWHTLGAYIGPAISLAGLSYLAGALDTLRSLGRP